MDPRSTSAIVGAMHKAEERAWNALSRYKFFLFGYYAAEWIHYNRLLRPRRHNPFRTIVVLAREHSQTAEQRRGMAGHNTGKGGSR